MNIERWGWYSVGLNVLLAALHAVIAVASGSLAVAAELVHNLVDLIAAVAVLVGLKLATRKSKDFPYGLYKLENLVALGLSVLIFLSAYEIARDAMLAPATAVHAEGWMLAVLLATGALPLVFSHFELRAGRAANSPALIADAKEYRVHVFTTGLAFAALASQWLDVPLDRLAAIIIVVAVAWTGWGLVRDAMRVLLDASLDAPTLLAIRRTIEADPAVRGVTWVTGRNAGRFRFVEAGIALRVAELAKAAAALQRIEAAVRAAVPHVERVLLRPETPAASSIRYAVPLADAAGTLSEHFGEAPFFALVSVRAADGATEEQRLVANPHRAVAHAKGIRVAEWLLAEKPDCVLLKRELGGKGPGYALRDAGVEIRRVEGSRLSDVLPLPRPAQGAGGVNTETKPP
jgi:cation diffusion facilitator family transporter